MVLPGRSFDIINYAIQKMDTRFRNNFISSQVICVSANQLLITCTDRLTIILHYFTVLEVAQRKIPTEDEGEGKGKVRVPLLLQVRYVSSQIIQCYLNQLLPPPSQSALVY